MPIIIMKNLVDQARQVQEKRVDGNWTVANIQIELEGIALAIKQLQAREMKFAGKNQLVLLVYLYELFFIIL